jgi:hypothetical protein
MATLEINVEVLNKLAARLKAGQAVGVEDADLLIDAAGLDKDEVESLAQVGGTHVVEWEDANTRHGHVPVGVPEHLVRGEDAAAKAIDDSEVYEAEPQGQGSNDPAVNALAVGRKPFENDSGIGHSGQVIDAAEYREDEKKEG